MYIYKLFPCGIDISLLNRYFCVELIFSVELIFLCGIDIYLWNLYFSVESYVLIMIIVRPSCWELWNIQLWTRVVINSNFYRFLHDSAANLTCCQFVQTYCRDRNAKLETAVLQLTDDLYLSDDTDLTQI